MQQTFFSSCQTLEQVMTLYIKLGKAYQPNVQTINIMAELKTAYTEACARVILLESSSDTEKEIRHHEAAIYCIIINRIIGLPLRIESARLWIWVSGDTFPHRKALDAAGLTYASRKKKWFFHIKPEQYLSEQYNMLDST